MDLVTRPRRTCLAWGLVFLELVEGFELNVSQLASKLSKLESSKKRSHCLEDVVVQDRFAIWVKVINKLVRPDQTKRISCHDLDLALAKIEY